MEIRTADLYGVLPRGVYPMFDYETKLQMGIEWHLQIFTYVKHPKVFLDKYFNYPLNTKNVC